MISTVSKTLKSPYAILVLIRLIATMVNEHPPLFNELESFLRNKNEMVVYEAAKTITLLENPLPTQKQLYPAVSALQMLLVSHKPVLRFAAIRTLNRLAMVNPTAVSGCNLDLENLLTDPNRSIATFAITALLKVLLSSNERI